MKPSYETRTASLKSRYPALAFAAARTAIALCVLLSLPGCGGGGDGAGPEVGRSTTFVGNVSRADATAALAAPGPGPVQVCVAGSGVCTVVDASGAFTLIADVGGDIVLEFEGPQFSATLPLADVPRGATVRIDDIVCGVASGQCHAANVDILPALDAPPDCSQATAQPAVLWPPNHALIPIAITGVFDPDGDPLAIAAVRVTQNEAVDARGSGNTAPDAQLDPLAVRAERSGGGNGRIYAIDFVADDGFGGTCAGTVYVCVPHDRGRGATCG